MQGRSYNPCLAFRPLGARRTTGRAQRYAWLSGPQSVHYTGARRGLQEIK